MNRPKALLLDIGGVLLTKGWGRDSRKRAAEHFGYDREEVEDRHQAVFHTYEEGGITLNRYLDWVVFYCKRDFSRKEYKQFMLSQSSPYPDTMDFFKRLKEKYGLKVLALSNEGRELTLYRVKKFDLESLVDFFVVSSFVHYRKPDPRIYHMAMDQVIVPIDAVVYIDDTPLLAEVAKDLGIPTIYHVSRDSTAQALTERGLSL